MNKHLSSFIKLSNLLPDFTCARTTGNLRSICLGINILSPVPLFDFKGDNPFLKT